MDRKGEWTPPSLKLIGAYLFLACALFEIIDGTQMHYCSRKHGRQQPPVPEGGKSLEFDLVRLVSARKIRGRRYQRVKRRRIVGGRKLGWLSSVLKCLSGFRPRSMDDCLPLVTMTVLVSVFLRYGTVACGSYSGSGVGNSLERIHYLSKVVTRRVQFMPQMANIPGA